jgi:hypothetical protein
MHPPRATGPFRYQTFDIDRATSTLTCRYALDRHDFAERFTFEPDGDWDDPAAAEAARLVFLLAGVSYYKTGAPERIDLGDLPTTDAERRFLTRFYRRGLAEFAFRHDLDLSGLVVDGPDRTGTRAPATGDGADAAPGAGRPLVPFGGGIDSIVTVEAVRRSHPDTELFVVSRPGDRFAAIERPAAVTGLPVRRAGRAVDEKVLRSAAQGFLNGHVPVTGILSAVAVLAAVLGHRDAVVMSNERSASVGNVTRDGVAVNHQWSKSLEFESSFRALLAESPVALPDYFSLLRPCSELWVARRFAELATYLPVFRSCNRAFTLDPAQRLDRWCGTCDKCCFIDLVLAPFVPADQLAKVFDGAEPLADPARRDQFRTLLGLTADDKPFECVGDVGECRASALLAANRPDRTATTLLLELASDAAAADPSPDPLGRARAQLTPDGPHHVPPAYAVPDGAVPDGALPDDADVPDAAVPGAALPDDAAVPDAAVPDGATHDLLG